MPIVVGTLDALGNTAQALLDASIAALNLTDAKAPTIAHLAPSLPALDRQCDQLIVYYAGIGEEGTQPLGPPPVTGKRAVRGRVNLPTLQVLAVRCIATAKQSKSGSWTFPTDEQQTADALKTMQDAWALWVNLAQQIRDDAWRSRCGDTHFAGVVPFAAQGGLAGSVATFHLELDGFVVA